MTSTIMKNMDLLANSTSRPPDAHTWVHSTQHSVMAPTCCLQYAPWCYRSVAHVASSGWKLPCRVRRRSRRGPCARASAARAAAKRPRAAPSSAASPNLK